MFWKQLGLYFANDNYNNTGGNKSATVVISPHPLIISFLSGSANRILNLILNYTHLEDDI